MTPIIDFIVALLFPPRDPAADNASLDPDAIKALETLVHNEQTKLTANAMNIVVAGLVVTGIIAPLTNAGTTVTPTTAIGDQSFAVMAIWFVAAIGIHGVAKLILRNQR